MRPPLLTSALVFASTLAAAAIGAQTPNAHAPSAHVQVAGTWAVRYEYQPTSMHNAAAGIEQRLAQITLRQNGDSVYGEWQAIVAAGDTAPPPRALRGVRKNDSLLVRFDPVVDEEASLISTAAHNVVEFIKTYVHGMPPTTTAIDVAVRGDSLTGTRRTILMDGTARGKSFVLVGARTKP